MRTRNVKKQIWLSEEEAKDFREKSRKVRINESHLFRLLLSGYHPPEAPPKEFYDDMNAILDVAEKFYALAERTRDPEMKELLKTAYSELREFRMKIQEKYLTGERVSVDFS